MTDIPDPQIYRAAADVIRRNGLCKGWMADRRFDPDAAKCPMSTDGSIRFAVSGSPYAADDAAVAATDWFDAFLASITPNYFDDFGDYVGWNGDPMRTPAEVIAALEAAATDAESARAAGQTGAS